MLSFYNVSAFFLEQNLPKTRATTLQHFAHDVQCLVTLTSSKMFRSHRVLSRKGRGLVNSHDPDKTVSLFGAKGSPLLYPGFSQRHTQRPRSSPSKTQAAYTVFRGKACSSTPLPSKCGGTPQTLRLEGNPLLEILDNSSPTPLPPSPLPLKLLM